MVKQNAPTTSILYFPAVQIRWVCSQRTKHKPHYLCLWLPSRSTAISLLRDMLIAWKHIEDSFVRRLLIQKVLNPLLLRAKTSISEDLLFFPYLIRKLMTRRWLLSVLFDTSSLVPPMEIAHLDIFVAVVKCPTSCEYKPRCRIAETDIFSKVR